jgi:hypothetical protein
VKKMIIIHYLWYFYFLNFVLITDVDDYSELYNLKQWVRHYKDEGIDDLKEKQRSGRPSKARNQNHTKLLQSILAMQNNNV